jgi:DNA mismatch repair ATPase MutS
VFRQIGPLMAAAQNLAKLQLPGTKEWSGQLNALLKSTARLRTVTRWVARDASTQDQLAAAVYEYFNLAFAIDGNALYFGVSELSAHRQDLGRILELVGKIDAAISIASWRSRRENWTNPAFTSAGAPATLKGLRHPLVDDCVPASVDLAPPNGLIVTGSNMSGKSTFLRTIGANVILAQSINTVLAGSYSAPIIGIRSCIGRSDDITTGTSYYMAEVRAVLSMVKTAEEAQQYLFLFDELFRGTNTAERIAAGQAVLENIIGQAAGHVVIAATHDGELVDRLRDSYTPVHFSEQLTPTGLTFDYQLRAGRATTRNAIALLEIEGAPASLVDRARTAL